MISPAVTNIIFMLVMMQLSRRIDLENEQNIMYIRTAYVISIVSAYIVYQIVKQKIIAKNDLTKVKVISPKNPMKPEESEKVTYMTVKDYDLDQINQAVKGIWTGVAMMGFMHFYMKFTNPLFMQCLNPIKGALEHNVTRINLWGVKAEGELQRPFKSAGFLDAFTKKPEDQQKTASVADVSSNEPKIVELNDEKATATVAAE
ncbi:SRP-independent targeting protein 3 [Monosporozyma unispora]|nr:phosphate transporter (Pho88) [Kazachstania unispora]